MLRPSLLNDCDCPMVPQPASSRQFSCQWKYNEIPPKERLSGHVAREIGFVAWCHKVASNLLAISGGRRAWFELYSIPLRIVFWVQNRFNFRFDSAGPRRPQEAQRAQRQRQGASRGGIVSHPVETFEVEL